MALCRSHRPGAASLMQRRVRRTRCRRCRAFGGGCQTDDAAGLVVLPPAFVGSTVICMQVAPPLLLAASTFSPPWFIVRMCCPIPGAHVRGSVPICLEVGAGA